MTGQVMSEGEWAQEQAQMHHGDSGFQLLAHGLEAYARRMLLAERACKTLDVQTYIFEDGHSTRRLIRQFIESAERGVKVRLLIDDLSVGHQQGRLAQLDAHPNIEIRVFNPIRYGRRFTLTRLVSLALNVRRLQRRMHNKLWIADGALAIWGGRNLSDRYFHTGSDFSFFDMDALAVGGKTVEQLQYSFDCYWNHALAVPLSDFIQAKEGSWQALDEMLAIRCKTQSEVGRVYDESLADLRSDTRDELQRELVWASADVHFDDPESLTYKGISPRELRMHDAVKHHFDTVHKSLHIVAGYFIPHDLAGIDVFALLDRKVKVTILTNSLESTDVPLVHGSYAKWRRKLLEDGAKLYETRHHTRSRQRLVARLRTRTRLKLSRTRTSSLHAKTYMFDDDRSMIASFNLDPRSVWWNTELGVVIYSKEINKKLSLINAIATLPEYSYRLRLIDGALRWFSISRHEIHRQYRFERGNPWRCFQGWLARVLRLEHLL